MDHMVVAPIRGMDLMTERYTPDGVNGARVFQGMVIPHGKVNTLSLRLRKRGYQPTVYVVYKPCPSARESLDQLKKNGYKMGTMGTRVFCKHEIVFDSDTVGALLWSNKYKPWWSGCSLSRLDVEKMGCTHAGPTTIQVAIALIAALDWQIKNANLGFISPEDLPLTVSNKSLPFLGTIHSRSFSNVDETQPMAPFQPCVGL